MPAVFESRDPTYQGIEKRTVVRRINSDRRESIRLDASETERRKIFGRRNTDHDIWQEFRPR